MVALSDERRNLICWSYTPYEAYKTCRTLALAFIDLSGDQLL